MYHLSLDEAVAQHIRSLLAAAYARAWVSGANHAGDISPELAWQLVHSSKAILIDVRSEEEWKFVGHVPGSIHVPWATGLALQRNPDFLAQLTARVSKDAVLLMLCRSGQRSVQAAEAATAAGFGYAFSVLEGFEGARDAHGQRGTHGGWRFYGLPWEQD